MTISSIGTASRTYSTITAWMAAFPGGSGTWEGECYNDSEFTESPTLTGTATCPVTLRAAVGQSAFDTNTNPLKYDVTKGVGLKTTANYGTALTLTAYATIQRLQVLQAGLFITSCISCSFGGQNITIDRCLAVSSDSSFVHGTCVYVGGISVTQKVLNSVIIAYKNTGINIGYGTGVALANNTVVAPSDQSNGSYAIDIVTQAPTITNCAGFGFGSGFCNGGSPTGTNNATDAATIGFTSSGSLTSKTYSSQFIGITTAAQNFRTKAAADLLDAGATDTTDIPAAIDIFATARPQGSAWDIGAHELIVVAVMALGGTLPMMGCG